MRRWRVSSGRASLSRIPKAWRTGETPGGQVSVCWSRVSQLYHSKRHRSGLSQVASWLPLARVMLAGRVIYAPWCVVVALDGSLYAPLGWGQETTAKETSSNGHAHRRAVHLPRTHARHWRRHGVPRTRRTVGHRRRDLHRARHLRDERGAVG